MEKKMLDLHREILGDFFSWAKLSVLPLNFRNDPGHWVAQRTDAGVEVNTRLASVCSPEWFNLLLLKATVHATLHGLETPHEEARCRKAFGERGMLMLDIEADLLVAQFLKETRGYGLALHLDILFEGIAMA